MLNISKKSYPDKNQLFQLLFGITFLFLFVPQAQAQVADTISKTSNIQHLTSNIQTKHHSTKMAALMSTVIPGLGQTYNKKYWKVPVIYGGLAALAYSINFNQTEYIKYLNAYKYRIDKDPLTIDNYPEYRDEALNARQEYFHRYRNLSVIGAALLYVMNIVDASVDAHMFTFDVSDNLSFNIHPVFINTASVNRYTTGLSLNIIFL